MKRKKDIAKSRLISVLSGLFILLFMASCEHDYFYFDVVEFDQSGWDVNQSQEFEFSTSDTSSYLDFYLDIRNNEDYRYRNIYAFVELEFPNKKKLTDTIHFPYMASPEGKWTGSGIGGSYDNSILYKNMKKLPLPGDYKIKVSHAMRDEVLVGIERVGVHIESHSEQ